MAQLNIFLLLLLMQEIHALAQNNPININPMFTIDQIKEAHSKVKTGADFPAYVQELKSFALLYYDHYVTDGHTMYYGKNGYCITAPANYAALPIEEKADKMLFYKLLKIHQEGGSNYLNFCRQAAETGVEKWRVDILQMTCTYYDINGSEMLVEIIPQP